MYAYINELSCCHVIGWLFTWTSSWTYASNKVSSDSISDRGKLWVNGHVRSHSLSKESCLIDLFFLTASKIQNQSDSSFHVKHFLLSHTLPSYFRCFYSSVTMWKTRKCNTHGTGHDRLQMFPVKPAKLICTQWCCKVMLCCKFNLKRVYCAC